MADPKHGKIWAHWTHMPSQTPSQNWYCLSERWSGVSGVLGRWCLPASWARLSRRSHRSEDAQPNAPRAAVEGWESQRVAQVGHAAVVFPKPPKLSEPLVLSKGQTSYIARVVAGASATGAAPSFYRSDVINIERWEGIFNAAVSFGLSLHPSPNDDWIWDGSAICFAG